MMSRLRLLRLLLPSVFCFVWLTASAAAANNVLVARYFFAASKFKVDGTLNSKPALRLLSVPNSPNPMVMVLRSLSGDALKTKTISGGKVDGTDLPFTLDLPYSEAQKPFSKTAMTVPAGGQYVLEFWAPAAPSGKSAPPKNTVLPPQGGFTVQVFEGTWRFVARDWEGKPVSRPSHPWPEPDPDGTKNRDGSTTYGPR